MAKEQANSQNHKPRFPGVPDLERSSSHLTVPWSVYRKGLTPNYGVVWRDMILCAVLLLSGIGAPVYIQLQLGNLLALALVPLSAIWIAYWLHSLHLFMHEAAHFGLHPNNHWNDRLANLFICSMIFTDINTYRKVHWQHHLHLGSPEDTENSYFNAMTPAFLVQTLTGIYSIKTLLKYSRHEEQMPKTNAGTSLGLRNTLRSLMIHSIVLILPLTLKCYAAPLSWLVGVAVFFPFFVTIRQVLRHRDENCDPKLNYNEIPHGPVLRSFGNDPISRTFGNAGFNLHLLHHWDPDISYTRLGEMEKYFKQTALAPIIEDSRRSYWGVFLTLAKKSA